MDILNHEFLSFLKCAQSQRLRYLLIGGYAVNYYGYSRNTNDMDIWLSPDNENRDLFINALLCMQYTETEVASLRKEDFTLPFVATIGNTGSLLDILTYVHQDISIDEAEKQKKQFCVSAGFSHLETLSSNKTFCETPMHRIYNLAAPLV
jgi:hypothetical protein